MKKILTFIFVLTHLCVMRSGATHIVGGELNYTWLGGDNYQIKLTVYRDCFNGVAPFDDPASIGVFDSSNILLGQLLVSIHDTAGVPAVISSPCLIPPTNICYSVAHYDTIINLPQLAGGYQLSYQRCCRNNSIVNIDLPGNTGATYYATIPDQGIVAVNSNPVFNNWPPTFICDQAPFTFDHSATDADGDSLVYEITDPLAGADPTFPQPQPPNAPPYIPVTWLAPYSLANVFGGTPLIIDPKTGILKCTPNGTGQFVYGVTVKEYRNGVYIGATQRDFQVNVTPCPTLTVSSILSPTIVCGDFTANFTNNSFGAATYLWDFGVASFINDTSSAFAPNYTYPDTGYYHVMLVAFSGINPNCNDTSYGDTYVYPPLQTDFNFSVVPCTDSVTFTDASSQHSGIVDSWTWNFGDSQTSTQEDILHVYGSNGNFNVTLITTTDKGCIDTITKPLVLDDASHALFTFETDVCHPEVRFLNLSQGGLTFHWDFGDGDTSNIASPVHIYKETDNYPVKLVINGSGQCADSITNTVTYDQSVTLPYFFPNAFTPNSDGLNDLFAVTSSNLCEPHEFYVFDRWGQLIFHTEEIAKGWDGTLKGKPVNEGVYIFMLKGDGWTKMGSITVVK